MADTTQIQQDILTCRLRAVDVRRAGDVLNGAAWDAEADALTDRMVLLERRSEWDALVDNRHG